MTTSSRKTTFVLILALCGVAGVLVGAISKPFPIVHSGGASLPKTYLGFDRNDYPGDVSMTALRKTFSFAGYWLNSAPGAKNNTWVGHRENMKKAGFGFAVLFNGRLDAELKKVDAARLGRTDAQEAVASSQREGFRPGTLIFLDQEEGGRMLPEQKAYLYAWVDGVRNRDFRAGVYCSGIGAPEGNSLVVTADDIRQNSGGREIEFWVSNDSCPPSPGCAYPESAPLLSESGASFAAIWQYAQSPRRRDFARGCSNYARDGNCYPLGPSADRLFVDLDSATSSDPSGGR